MKKILNIVAPNLVVLIYIALDYYFAFVDSSESTTIQFFSDQNYRTWLKIEVIRGFIKLISFITTKIFGIKLNKYMQAIYTIQKYAWQVMSILMNVGFWCYLYRRAESTDKLLIYMGYDLVMRLYGFYQIMSDDLKNEIKNE